MSGGPVSRLLLLAGDNYGWNHCVSAAAAAALADRWDVAIEDDKSILASDELDSFAAVVMGTGFTRRVVDGSTGAVSRIPEFDARQSRGLLDFVESGAGFVGFHGTGWNLHLDHVELIGGHANVHPARGELAVSIARVDHPVTDDIEDFTVADDECYLSAVLPTIDVLATASWSGFDWPVAWTHSYGDGRVFYSCLGHGPSTFEHPAVTSLLRNAAAWVIGPPGASR